MFEYLDKAGKGIYLWFLNLELQGEATNDIPVASAAYAGWYVLFYLKSLGIDIGRVTLKFRKRYQIK